MKQDPEACLLCLSSCPLLVLFAIAGELKWSCASSSYFCIVFKDPKSASLYWTASLEEKTPVDISTSPNSPYSSCRSSVRPSAPSICDDACSDTSCHVSQGFFFFFSYVHASILWDRNKWIAVHFIGSQIKILNFKCFDPYVFFSISDLTGGDEFRLLHFLPFCYRLKWIRIFFFHPQIVEDLTVFSNILTKVSFTYLLFLNLIDSIMVSDFPCLIIWSIKCQIKISDIRPKVTPF